MPSLPGKPPAVHIYSDGTTGSTRVVGPDGQEIPKVKSLEITADAASQEFSIRLELWGGVIDLDGPLHQVIFVCPLCKTEAGSHSCLGS